MGITSHLECDRCGHEESGSVLKDNWAWIHIEECVPFVDIETGVKVETRQLKGRKLLCPTCLKDYAIWFKQ